MPSHILALAAFIHSIFQITRMALQLPRWVCQKKLKNTVKIEVDDPKIGF